MLENHYPQPAVFRPVRRPRAHSALSHPVSDIPQSIAGRLQGRTPQPSRSARALAQARVANLLSSRP